MNLKINHPDIHSILDKDEPIELLASGFDFLEGPIWHPIYKSILFSDIMGNSIFSWRADSRVQKRSRNSYMANGNAYDLAGRLLTCEHATSRVTRTDLTTGSYEVLASHYDGKELNSPNDIIVKRDGMIYFTDPASGRSAEYGVPREAELPFKGVYCLNPNTKKLTLLIDDFELPNGLCFSRDEKQLYVNDTIRKHIRVFDVTEAGLLENGRIFAETKGDAIGVPDGMKIDTKDNIYCCGPGGIHLFNKVGEHLGVIQTPEPTANFCFGDADMKTLYITASTSLYKLRTKLPGHPII